MPVPTTPEEGGRKTQKMINAIAAAIDDVNGGERDDGTTNAALAGVIGTIARTQNDPDEWIAGMFAIVRQVRNAQFNRR